MCKIITKLCYYPTKVIIVDDDVNFTNAISLNLNKRFSTLCFSDPRKAKGFIIDTSNNQNIDRYFSDVLKSFSNNEDFFELKLPLYLETYNKERFDLPTVLVVDYSMPQMHGLELCEQLQDLPIKKLMLTGEADSDLAVNAFNAGLIDMFIPKNSHNMLEKLTEGIEELQNKYFMEAFKLADVSFEADNVFPYLNEGFSLFFEDLCKRNNIVEYYCFDINHGFLLVNDEGEIFWLVVMHKNHIHDYVDIASDNNAPNAVIESLKTYRKIPLFLTEEDKMVRPHDWDIFNSSKIDGTDYYYAWINNDELNKIAIADMTLHKDYLINDTLSIR